MDVKTAFLNGHHEKEICTNQPKWFMFEGLEGKMCKLKKGLFRYQSLNHMYFNIGQPNFAFEQWSLKVVCLTKVAP